MSSEATLADHFKHPIGVGQFSIDSERVFTAQMGNAKIGDAMQLQIQINDKQDDLIEKVLFQAYGDQYLIAACSLAVEYCQGNTTAILDKLNYNFFVEQLAIPEVKKYEAIMIEDALKTIAKSITAWQLIQSQRERNK